MKLFPWMLEQTLYVTESLDVLQRERPPSIAERPVLTAAGKHRGLSGHAIHGPNTVLCGAVLRRCQRTYRCRGTGPQRLGKSRDSKLGIFVKTATRNLSLT